MTLALPAVLLLLAGAYAAIVGSWALGLRRVLRASDRSQTALNGHRPFVSVIVPARDEEETVEACLRSILACDYPEDLFEVIVVDDQSRDATPAVVQRLAMELASTGVPVGLPDYDEPGPSEPLRLVRMPEHLDRSRAHKKRAITAGIELARGHIILSTDADCTVPGGWIREMVGAFEDGVGLVSGPVLYQPARGFFGELQVLEFMGLVAVGAGAIGAGRPNLCNGANVAYRRDVFDEVGGFRGIDHLTSGDDELLMQKIAYDTPWEVRFCAHRDAAVRTRGMPTASAFFQQRKRWASKGRHYAHAPLRAAIAGIYAFYVVLLAAPVLIVLGWLSPGVLAVAACLKVVPEAALLGPFSARFGRSRSMAYFLPAQPLHVLYIVAMGAAGAVGGYEWKGRRVER